MNDNLTVTLLCSVLIAFSIAFAQTEIEGEVSGVWTAEGSPYIVLDSTWVPAGEELTILEGVTVRFADQTGLYVHGVMSAIGSEEDSVHFTTIEEGEEWLGIYFYQPEDEYEFDYCTIRNAFNGLVTRWHTYVRVTNSDINCNYIAFGTLDPNNNRHVGNRYYFESSIIIGSRRTPFNSSSLTAIDSYFATGSGDSWGFTNRGSVEFTDCKFVGSIRTSSIRGIFRRCNFYQPENNYCNISVSGGGALIQDCYVDGSVWVSGNQSDIFGNEIVGKLTLEIYSGLVSDNELGSLEITICDEPVTITNCEVRERIIINSNSEVEIYNCKLLGIVEPRRTALIMNGPGRNRNASYNIHHNLILGSISIRDQLDLEFRNNTIITDSLYLVPLIDARTDHGSLDISNNILICNGANAGVYDSRGPVADEPNIMYNCMLGFEQFSYRNRELDFELDESNLFDVDPLLVELDPLDPHLTADSPCIDAGDPDSPLDPDSTRADIGMFYFHHELRVKPRHEVELPYTELLSVYPNPFNGVSTFAFSLSQPSTVMIDIFNTLGRKQVNLASGNYSTGLHSLSWDGGGLPSGEYIARMSAGGRITSRKVCMIK